MQLVRRHANVEYAMSGQTTVLVEVTCNAPVDNMRTWQCLCMVPVYAACCHAVNARQFQAPK